MENQVTFTIDQVKEVIDLLVKTQVSAQNTITPARPISHRPNYDLDKRGRSPSRYRDRYRDYRSPERRYRDNRRSRSPSRKETYNGSILRNYQYRPNYRSRSRSPPRSYFIDRRLVSPIRYNNGNQILGSKEPGELTKKPKRIPIDCMFWMNGNCRNGRACKYIHNGEKFNCNRNKSKRYFKRGKK